MWVFTCVTMPVHGPCRLTSLRTRQQPGQIKMVRFCISKDKIEEHINFGGAGEERNEPPIGIGASKGSAIA
jgi:hypothetical protein